MPRPVSIDRRAALRAARQLFWRQGFTATPMKQLLQDMGIGSGSFYAAFESKAGLYRAVIDDYAAWSGGRLGKIRQLHRGAEAIRLFLAQTLVEVDEVERRKGCLLVNTVLELEGVEPGLQQRASAHLRELEDQLRICLLEEAALGGLRRGMSAGDAARLLMTLIQGLRVESRQGLTQEQARHRIDLMLTAVSEHYLPTHTGDLQRAREH